MTPVDLIIILAVVGVGGLAWRKRLSETKADPPPAAPPTGASPGGADAEMTSNDPAVLRAALARAREGQAAAEATAREARERMNATVNPAEVSALRTQLDNAQAAAAARASEAARLNEAALAAERARTQQAQALAQRAIDNAPRKARVEQLLRDKRAAVQAAEVIIGASAQQRRVIIDTLPEYRDILGYTADDSVGSQPYSSARRAVLLASAEGLTVQTERAGGVVPGPGGFVTVPPDPNRYPNILLVNDAMKRSADRIDALTRAIRDAAGRKANLLAEIAPLERELADINASITGSGTGVVASGQTARKVPIGANAGPLLFTPIASGGK